MPRDSGRAASGREDQCAGYAYADCPDCVTKACWEYNETTCRAVACIQFWIDCEEEGAKLHCKVETENICRTPYEMSERPEQNCPETPTCGEAGQKSLPFNVSCCAYDEESECEE